MQEERRLVASERAARCRWSSRQRSRSEYRRTVLLLGRSGGDFISAAALASGRAGAEVLDRQVIGRRRACCFVGSSTEAVS